MIALTSDCKNLAAGAPSITQWSNVKLSVSISRATICPSSAGLARAMANGLGPDTGRVIEFGAGTGVITRAILARGVRPADVTMFEMNPDFTASLTRQFPGTILHNLPA